MLLKSKKLSLIAVLALLGATLVAPPAWAVTVSCSTSGSFTVTNNAVAAFSNCAGEAEIPNSVTRIDGYAFANAKSLTSVTFEADSVLKSIGGYAFFNTSLTSITIPKSVTTIGQRVFHSVTSLTSITFEADSVLKSIGDYAFFSNDSLTSITIPNSVTSIGSGAFSYSDALTSITFQGDAPSVGINGFASVGRDAKANIGFSAKEFGTATKWQGLTINRDAAGTVRCSTSGTFTVTDNVVTGNTNCAGSAVIPNTVTSIGNRAFADARALQTVSFAAGSALASIGNSAFDGARALTSITIPNSVTSIGEYAFNNASALTSITIPNRVTSIALFAFNNATALTSVAFAGDAPTTSFWAFNNVGAGAVANIGSAATGFGSATTWNGLEIVRAGTVRCSTSGTFTVTDNVVTGNTNCAGSAVIPNTVTSIGNRAFADARALQTVSFAAGSALASIGNSAFDGARALTSITIPNSVTSIGEYAFNNASALTSITIPNRVTSIALYAFNNATALTSVAFAGDAPTTSFWAFNNVGAGAVANIGSAATGFGSATTWNGLEIVRAGTVRCSTSGTFTVTDNVVTEGADCVGSAVIPNSATSIGGDAFAGATSLTSLTIPDSVTSIGSYAFRNTSLTSITIPDSVTSISNFAFSRATALTSITIPDSVTSISNYAFWYATALTSVTIPDSVTSIGQGAFEGATALTSITIPDSVTSIGQGAFWYTALTSITIPNSVTSIGNEAFSDTTALTSITIPDSVTSIGSYAFSDATALTSITIPDSVISIGQGAFDGATSLTLVTFAGNAPKTVGRDAFSSVGNDPVANIGIAAEDFGTATTWNGLRIVRAADPTPPTATPVSGDTNAGATLVIKGTNMDRITEVKIGGTVVPITARTTTSITVTVPAGLAVGNYSITLTTDDAAVLTGGFAQVVAGEVKAATNQKVNAGSFNTYVAVYAKGYKGQRLSWKIAGKWFKTILTKDYQVFQRKTIAVGLEVKVDLFIDGKRLLAKTVLTR